MVLDEQGVAPALALEGVQGEPRLLLLPSHDADAERWVLTVPAGARVHVNGEPVAIGLRVLVDRDAIQLGGGACVFFTAERPAQIERLAASAERVTCARCGGEIADGAAIVRCPVCRLVHHQTDEMPCWTGYADEPFATCTQCESPAVLDGRLRWTPAGL
jgi:hypothetical protein